MAPRTTYANLTDGLQPFSLWDQSLADMGKLGIIPCTAVGTNAITLTPIAANFSPTISAYQNYLLFSFVVVATSTGNVTVSIGTLGALPVYKGDATTRAGTGDIVINSLITVAYNSALNGGSGGFQLFNSSSSGAGGLVQVTGASAVIPAGTTAVAIVRVSPTATALTLPTVAAQAGLALRIFDWSTAVTDHAITITPNGAETIMLQATWPIYSNTVSLGSATFNPSVPLSGWYIAP